MSTTSVIARDRHNTQRMRFWVFMVACGIASTLAIPLAPGTAHAANVFWHCPFPAPYIPPTFPVGKSWTETRYPLVSAVPTFDVADSRIVVNDTASPVTATFTSQRSTTFTLQVTVGTAIRVGELLTVTVSTTIVLSRTTMIGISATGQVPPHSRLIGEYGVQAYNATYDLTTYRIRVVFPAVPGCDATGVQRASTNAPTSLEGWRLRAG